MEVELDCVNIPLKINSLVCTAVVGVPIFDEFMTQETISLKNYFKLFRP